MADHQRVHPVDLEARPTAPLVSRESSRSEKGEPIEHYPPPPRRTFPVSHSKPPKRSCCCRCLCWTISLLILQVIVVAIAGAILYLVFQPKLPKYSVDRLLITSFQPNSDGSLYAQFNVTITARNPNKKIGIYYEDGSQLSVYYTDTKLCEGSLPKFYQGHQNTTVLNVALTGQVQDGNALMSTLTAQQQTGSIPLRLRARVPVKVKLGKLKLKKVKFLVRCNLVVDSLAANGFIRIRTSSCKFRFRL
ncbi:PREDICTED: protein YLS9-like [Nelumbo nucifera]|uniref:Protein YLS9-like n=1 Tax=Nelumbo nucifera TaxID=4432 RepID=A0A1U7Z8I6_NELNU|nr:PREDICTED: protein YLS9-like [Nelumbo nucifera]